MTDFQMITVHLKSGEQITMTACDVRWHDRNGRCVGLAAMDEFLDFLKEKAEDIKYDASMEHGEDAAS
jgi:hypothetical protein